MATFTMELRDAIESLGGNIGLDDYPIFDEGYRTPLNTKITNHFRFREIGVETPNMFAFYMRQTMHEIMPPMNELYKSAQFQFDPLSTIRMETLSHGSQDTADERVSHAGQESATDAKSRAVSSETPQVALSGHGDYATGLTDSTSDGSSTTTTDGTDKGTGSARQESATLTSGRTLSASSLLMEYRNTIINIDMMIIDQLNPLFMGIWNNGDDLHPMYSRIPYGYNNILYPFTY